MFCIFDVEQNVQNKQWAEKTGKESHAQERSLLSYAKEYDNIEVSVHIQMKQNDKNLTGFTNPGEAFMYEIRVILKVETCVHLEVADQPILLT